MGELSALVNDTFLPMIVFNIGMKITLVSMIVLNNQVILFAYALCFGECFILKGNFLKLEFK
jgi:hypothetical protein